MEKSGVWSGESVVGPSFLNYPQEPMPPRTFCPAVLLTMYRAPYCLAGARVGRQRIRADTCRAGFPHFPHFFPHSRPGCRLHESSLSALPHLPHLQMQETVSEVHREHLASGL